MYLTLLKRLRETLAGHIREKYGVELPVVLERPPKLEMGEAASPVCFELAKRLKKAPRQIAQEIATALPKIEGIGRVEVAGAGYLNAFFNRATFFTSLVEELQSTPIQRASYPLKVIVEHTSINPNKAAHIGHLRNAVLGDTIVRLLRYAGRDVAVQNYIDNTGVQVADVVIALWEQKKYKENEIRKLLQVFANWRGDHRRPRSVMDAGGDFKLDDLRRAGQAPELGEEQQLEATNSGGIDSTVEMRIRKAADSYRGRIDYFLWDTYAQVTTFLGKDKQRAANLRTRYLGDIERGGNAIARSAELISNAIVSCHLRTMARLGIYYELLARESEVLHLHFWDAAFEKLKASGAIQFATSGKNAGCWIIPWNQKVKQEGVEESPTCADTPTDQDPSPSSTHEDQAKIIVRSNGIVTYVGKDIAYQLWKFGLLGKDFNYRKWPDPPDNRTVWATTTDIGDVGAPHFGRADVVYNVIDTRQAYLQDVVAEGLRLMGHTNEAEKSVHLDYEIVALTPRCASRMGYKLPVEDKKRMYVEVSGRKGIGVKADNLITMMIRAAQSRVRKKHPRMPQLELKHTAKDLAVGALRFFLLKVTRPTVIAFDFDDALNAEGETGPYCQYAIVRIRGIRRKGHEASGSFIGAGNSLFATLSTLLRDLQAWEPDPVLANQEDEAIWTLLLEAGSLDYAVDRAISTQEPAFVSRYAFQLAQAFNNFYHKHHILSEADEEKRAFLLGLTELVERQLVGALGLLGIEAPEKM